VDDSLLALQFGDGVRRFSGPYLRNGSVSQRFAVGYVMSSPSDPQEQNDCAKFVDMHLCFRGNGKALLGGNAGYWEKGYISQPIPTATKMKARKAHSVYFMRSRSVRLERNAKVIDTTSAKNIIAPKWVRLPNRALILDRPPCRYHRLLERSKD